MVCAGQGVIDVEHLIIAPLASSIVSFLVGGVLAWLISALKHRRKEHGCMELGMMYLLRKDLIERCDALLLKSYIPPREADSVRAENAIYHALGGNGDIKSRMERIEHRLDTQKRS